MNDNSINNSINNNITKVKKNLGNIKSLSSRNNYFSNNRVQTENLDLSLTSNNNISSIKTGETTYKKYTQHTNVDRHASMTNQMNKMRNLYGTQNESIDTQAKQTTGSASELDRQTRLYTSSASKIDTQTIPYAASASEIDRQAAMTNQMNKINSIYGPHETATDTQTRPMAASASEVDYQQRPTTLGTGVTSIKTQLFGGSSTIDTQPKYQSHDVLEKDFIFDLEENAKKFNVNDSNVYVKPQGSAPTIDIFMNPLGTSTSKSNEPTIIDIN